jgi:copper(I)-binding protein
MKILLSALIGLAMTMGFAFAHDHTMHTVEAGNLAISNVWTRATPDNARAAAGFLTIKNKGDVEDVLIEIRSDISERVEIHAMDMSNGVMTMRPVDGGIVIPAGEEVSLKPCGFHVMFIGMEEQLIEGEAVNIALVFANAGEVEVEMKIAGLGAKAMPH